MKIKGKGTGKLPRYLVVRGVEMLDRVFRGVQPACIAAPQTGKFLITLSCSKSTQVAAFVVYSRLCGAPTHGRVKSRISDIGY